MEKIQKTEKQDQIERGKTRKKLLNLVRVVLVGIASISMSADRSHPQKEALNIFTSNDPNKILVNGNNVINAFEDLPNSGAIYGETVKEKSDIFEEQLPPKMIDDKDKNKNQKEKINDASTSISESVHDESISPILQTGEYTPYSIFDQNKSIGLKIDGHTNYFLPVEKRNTSLKFAFSNDQFIKDVALTFNPGFSDTEVQNYLDNYKILVGQDVDYYLESVRNGSWGTTIATIDKNNKIRFESVSFKSFLVTDNYSDDEWGSFSRLIREEFFQAHQYNQVFANLFNSGYLAEVEGIKDVDSAIGSISDKNWRAFLELFPQQKILTDSGVGGNAYHFYIGTQFFDGYTPAVQTVNNPYNTLVGFIENELNINCQPESFLNPVFIKQINNAFREKYTSYYMTLGFSHEEIQIWNLVGMERQSQHLLDMPALLPLPE